MKKRMKFEAGEISAPGQRGKVVDTNVADGDTPGLARNRGCIHPRRSILGRVFFVKSLPANTVWKALHCDRAPGEMREEPLCTPRLVVDDVRLRKTIAGVQHFVEIGEREPVAVDLNMLRRRHVNIFALNAR